MALCLFALSLSILAVALSINLRIVQGTRRGLPWLSLAALGALAVWLLRVPLTGKALELGPEALGVALAAAALLAVRSMAQWTDDLAQARDERDAAQESYTALLHNLPIAAAVLDPHGSTRLLNPAQMASLTGAGPEDAAPRQPWLDLVHAEDRGRLDEAVSNAREGQTSRVEVRLEHRSGAWRWADILLFPRRHASHVKGTNVLVSDVTERRLLDERLRDLQKMGALGAMAGGIAHDFNNLLGAIVGSVDLAERKVGPAHAAGNDLRRARNVALRASRWAW